MNFQLFSTFDCLFRQGSISIRPNGFFYIYSLMPISQKMVESIYTFLKTPQEFLGFLLYPWKFQTKQSLTLETPQNCIHSSEILRLKTKIPGDFTWFFLITPGNSTLFLINPCIFFFWKSPILAGMGEYLMVKNVFGLVLIDVFLSM